MPPAHCLHKAILNLLGVFCRLYVCEGLPIPAFVRIRPAIGTASTFRICGGSISMSMAITAAGVSAAREWVRGCAEQIASRLRLDGWIYAAIGAYTAFGLLFLHVSGNEDQATYAIYIEKWVASFLILMPISAVAFDVLAVCIRFNARRSLAYRRSFSARRVAGLISGMMLLMMLMLFQGTFTSIKNTLPILHGGFPYDRLHADIDDWLHLGTAPWRLLYAVGATDMVRAAVEWNYNVLWFIVCFGSLFFVATSPRADAVRGRYMLMFMFVWIFLGNVLAGIFLSAGPAFYGAVTGDSGRFAEQLAFLAESGGQHSAVAYQEYLWSLYSEGKAGFGSGISAFPSVHVGLITMNALFLAELSRRKALAAILYTALILASSVYLGWHYAIDGYVSILATVICHFALRRFLVRRTVGGSPPSEALAPAA